MRICEGLIAIPGVLLAIALMAALGASSINVIIALTIVYTPSVARIVRGSALVTREQTFVEAAKVQGASSARILWKLILPNVISPLTVQASFIFASGNYFGGFPEFFRRWYSCTCCKLGKYPARKQTGAAKSSLVCIFPWFSCCSLCS